MTSVTELNNASKSAIYPTLVIGLGGAGTNVVRHVKQRFLRSWQQDDLPDILQVLAVDTEPLVNRAGETPLFFNEFAFLGKFDATKLVANRKHHPYLSWWGDDRDIPLGYVHNGAKQLRPIGRLAFFRNYLVFQKMMTDKVRKMLALRAIQEAEQRGFEVMRNHRLIFIVSSLCGGTGAGMFLDVAHRVRHEVGSNATIIGIFFLPSVFEGTISSHIQRRRIRANAYAALKELEHFHETQSFKAFYPGEQTPLPTVPYRAFTRMFLVDIFNSEGITLSDKAQVEKMAAHFIHLLTFSPLNKDIIGQDVNAHSSEEVTASGRHRNFSAFACAAVVMDRTNMREFIIKAITERAYEFLKLGIIPYQQGIALSQVYIKLRDDLKDKFRTYAASEEELDNLAEDLARQQGRWLGFANEIMTTMATVLENFGMERLSIFAHRLALKPGSSEIGPNDLTDKSHFPLERRQKPEPPRRVGFWERLIPRPEEVRADEAERQRYERELAEYNRLRKAETVWTQLLEKIQVLAASYESWAQSNLAGIANAQKNAGDHAQKILQVLDPLRPGDGDDGSTIYEMETGAMRSDYARALFQTVYMLLTQPVEVDAKRRSVWQILHARLCEKILPRAGHDLKPISEGDIDSANFFL